MAKRISGRAPAENTADALHSAAIHMLRKLRRLDDKTELAAPQLSALSVLVFGGPKTLGELAAAEQVRPASMTNLVRKLEAAGLVQRRADKEDARRTILKATNSAKSVLQQGRGRRVEALARFVRGLAKEDRQTLKRAAELMKEFAQTQSEGEHAAG